MASHAEALTRVKDVEALRDLDVSVRSAAVGNDLYIRHINPIGSYGGFVAKTAKVTADSFIGIRALVLDSAVVIGGSSLTGKSTARDFAKVINSTLAGSPQVKEDAQVIKSHVLMGCVVTGNSVVVDSTISFNAYVTGSLVEKSDIGEDRFLVDISVRSNIFEGYVKEGSDGKSWLYGDLWTPLRRIE